jgi:hypothetical protein
MTEGLTMTDTADGFKLGDVLTSPSGFFCKVVELVAKDPRWKCSGYRVLQLDNGTGDGHGFTEFLAGYLASSWRVIEVDGPWLPAPRTGGELEERFVSRGSSMARELRKITPGVTG